MTMAQGYSGAVETLESVEIASAQIQRQRSTKFSLYPARPRTSSKDSSTASYPSSPITPTTPQIPPHQIPSREDSLPTHPPRSFPLQYTRPSEGSRAFTSPASIPQSLHRKPSEASRLRALNNGYRSHSTDGRQTPDRRAPGEPVDNFSRKRNPSLRRRNDSPNPLHPPSGYPLRAHNEEQTAAELASSRERGLSISSSQSATQNATIPPPSTAYPLRPSASIPDYQSAESIYSRQRNLHNPHFRPPPANRPDSNYSAHLREQPPRPPGYDDEEVRASFRSALTTGSSLMGTSGTERSSVMTKSSSATSIFGGRDEGMSVDDAIGMYEGGFQDSGVEDNYRPSTSASLEEKRRSKIEEAMNDTLAPPQQITRDSAAMFSNTSPLASPTFPKTSMENNMVGDGEKERPAINRPVTKAEPTHFDETRDRYGFRKKTQNVSLEAYETWNGPYKEYTARRRRKWVALMKDNGLPTENPQVFPPKSMKTRRFVRKGIPAEWRGAAWFFYAGGHSMLSKNAGVYQNLVKKAENGGLKDDDEEIIERDLHRSFPDNARFKPDLAPGEVRDSRVNEVETPILQALRRVLQAFSIHNPSIGYCQSLNFLAGLLLLFMDEEKSFWMLNIITGVYLPGTHSRNLEGNNVDLGVLMISIKDMMPSIWTKICGELDGSTFSAHSMHLPPITLCLTSWFMSCFIGTLPIETTIRVWDSFFYEGSKTLFRIALTIFKVGEAEIKAVTDPMEIFQVVQNMPRKLIDANALVEACFKRRNGFGHISQDTIEKIRIERRKGYAEERQRVADGERGDKKHAARSIRKVGIFKRKTGRAVNEI